MNEQLHVYMSNRHKETFAFVWSSLLLAVFFFSKSREIFGSLAASGNLAMKALGVYPNINLLGGKAKTMRQKMLECTERHIVVSLIYRLKTEGNR